MTYRQLLAILFGAAAVLVVAYLFGATGAAYAAPRVVPGTMVRFNTACPTEGAMLELIKALQYGRAPIDQVIRDATRKGCGRRDDAFWMAPVISVRHCAPLEGIPGVTMICIGTVRSTGEGSRIWFVPVFPDLIGKGA